MIYIYCRNLICWYLEPNRITIIYIQVEQSKNFYRIVRDILWTLVLFIWQLEMFFVCLFLAIDFCRSKTHENQRFFYINTLRRRGALGSASDSWSVDTCQSWVRAPSKAPLVSLSKKLYSHCLVLVGSRNGFERDLHKQILACFTIKLK